MDCKALPTLLSAFVDTFVDFTVSGLFLPTPTTDRTPSSITTRLPTPPRLVAIGDLHGDLPKSLRALSLAAVLDPLTLRWSGGSSTAVQVGDVLDRGHDEITLLYLLHRLRAEAADTGGTLVSLLGNHEVMNVEGDFRYVTMEGLRGFEIWGWWYRKGMGMKRMCEGVGEVEDPFVGVPTRFRGVRREFWEGLRARIAALRPNGPIARRFLVGYQTVAVVGDSVFVHGGLLQEHVSYGLEKINEEARDWIRGLKGRRSPGYLRGRDSIVWLRRFSTGGNSDCQHLQDVLSMIPGVARMVMGHTIQREGINSVCGNQALRIDVGLSEGCGDGIPQVLEINKGQEIRVLTSNLLHPSNGQSLVRGEKRNSEKKGLAWLVPDTKPKEVEVKA